MTLASVHISGYRSIYGLRFLPGRLTAIAGINGVGKSSLCHSLELLCAAAHGRLAVTLAQEGGLESAAWAGPEQVRSPAARRRGTPIQGTVRKGPIRVQLGVQFDVGGFEMSLGFTSPSDRTLEVKEESLWPAPARRARQPSLVRDGSVARYQDEDGKWHPFPNLDPSESVLSQMNEQFLPREFRMVREELQGMHFYHTRRTDLDGPGRAASGDVDARGVVSARDPVATALQVIEERGDAQALRKAVWHGLDSELVIDEEGGRLQVGLRQHGKLRTMRQEEWSDGTRRYIVLLAQLLAPQPASLLCFDEPEMHLHPKCLEQIATQLALATQRTDVWVTTHAITLLSALKTQADVTHIELELDEDGVTVIKGQRLLDIPPWP